MTLSETPVVDRDRGPTLRVLIHGAPYSGKTTTARTLGERLGQVVQTPEEDIDGRTVLFDWMEYVGGRFEGGPIHTQLVTVPGHDPERRAHLLRDADVVLFVVDTRADALRSSAEMLDEVRGHLRDRPDTVGLVIQANKRDDPAALPIDEVSSSLGLTADDVVIETVASDGSGVRQAFVYAVRLGLQHFAARSDEDVRRASSPDELVAELRSTIDADEIEVPDLAETTVEPEPASDVPAPRLLDTLLATQPRGEKELTERLVRECIDRAILADDDGPAEEEAPRLRSPLWRWLRG